MQKLILAALAILPSAAAAQSTTTCQRLGDFVTCRTNPTVGLNPSIPQAFRGFDVSEIIRQQRERQEPPQPMPAPYTSNPETIYNLEDRFTQERVGKLIAEGQCETAELLALRMGNVSLAKTVREYCSK